MHMWKKDMGSAYFHTRRRDEELRFMVMDCGPHPDGLVASAVNPRFVLVVASPFGWSKSGYAFETVKKPYVRDCRAPGATMVEHMTAAERPPCSIPPSTVLLGMKTSMYCDDQAAGDASCELAKAQERRASG